MWIAATLAGTPRTHATDAAVTFPSWTAPNRAALVAAWMQRRQHGLPDDPRCTPETLREDAVATECLLREVRDLARGATTAFGPDWHLPRPAEDLAGLTAALQADGLAAYLAALPPKGEPYRALQAALAQYRARAVAEDPALWTPLAETPELKLDVPDGRLATVTQRLRAEGDLARQATAPEALRAAIRHFQARHGLESDGRLGKETMGALNLTPYQSEAMIAVALERLRASPRALAARRVEVDITDQTARLIDGDRTVIEMRAVVGTPAHPTPTLAARITAVTFNPAWTIPMSIARAEILPKLRRHPSYLRDNEMVILGRDTDPYGLTVDWSRVSAAQFPFQLRQDPGTKNPLGAVKFEMPNSDDVYLHDTPAKALFLRPRRTFSHGCVRLADAASLARQLLASLGGEPLPAGGETVTVPILQPVAVYLLYRTVFVDERGALQFRSDVYRRDSAIAAALGYDLDRTVPPRAEEGPQCETLTDKS